MTAKIKKKLLFYIEPHPIRNLFSCFLNLEVRILIRTLLEQLPDEYDLRIFSNDVMITMIQHDIPEASAVCFRPTESESRRIYEYLRQWGDAAIEERNELVLGTSDITKFYCHILARIHDELYEFDRILAWSDNGAVKQFAYERGIVALFAELGPTRRPYCPTLYFDHEGTNGFASISQTDVEDLEPMAVVPHTVWSLAGNKRVYDEPLTLRPAAKEKEAKLVLKHPYIFVALQLADDLNTVLCSHYQRPVDFLQQIIKDFQGTEYDIVVKGHPGAALRAYNLKAQKEAEELAEKEAHVHFLANDVDEMETISWYVHAAAVVSINSSLSFEALLSGKKSYVAGDAVYNLSGLMNYTPERILAGEAESNQLDRMVSFLCGHYLHPASSVFETDLVYRLFDFYAEMMKQDQLGTREFWQQYAKRFSDGFQMLVPEEFREEDVPESHLPLVSVLIHPAYVPVGLVERASALAFQFQDRAGKPYVTKLQNGDWFECCIEQVVEKGSNLFVTGWAFERERKLPATQVLVFHDGKFLSRHRVMVARPDIRREHCLSEMMDFGFQFECPNVGRDNSRYDILLLAESGRVQLVRMPSIELAIETVAESGDARTGRNTGMLVYGVGAHLKDMLKWYPEITSHVLRVFDKDPKKAGRLAPGIGIPIEPLDAVRYLPDGTEIAIAAIRYFDEIVHDIHAIQPGIVCRNIDEVWMKYV
ncbi:hypothetical protein [uncultured Selenomonas sp.]|uniref:capsular polysaccharide export protein, LipB/KpsS family n=1 Tax=uncultured Selenomonas sp. TaxID=159275 RepID=UPI0025E992DA|nr:hypothetical protein [uncultured Selenomonas sp.]